MKLYWLYDLHNWLFALITVLTFAVPGVVGLLVTRPFVRKWLNDSGRHNDVVSFYFAAVGVFYGLALGLIAVATYQNYTDADSKAAKEANAIASLYRDLDSYSQPFRGTLETQIKQYIKFIIEHEWPAHHQGEMIPGGEALIDQSGEALGQIAQAGEGRGGWFSRERQGEITRQVLELVAARFGVEDE